MNDPPHNPTTYPSEERTENTPEAKLNHHSVLEFFSDESDSENLYSRTAWTAQELLDRLRQQEKKFLRLKHITEEINHGVELQQVLDAVYKQLQEVIPYDRMGCALIEQLKEGSDPIVVAKWARSNRPMALETHYRGPLRGSSLERIVKSMQPRIINDLEEYLSTHPGSESTRLIVKEGMRSSLTCPLIVEGKPIGFLFFTSGLKNAYQDAHISFFQHVASQLAMSVEKGRLYSELENKNEIVERQYRAMKHDLETARSVQRALIPHDEAALKTTGLNVAFTYEPAQHVGGDILDVIPISDGRAFFFIGDAMGHGVQAALVMSIVKTALISAVTPESRPAEVLGYINRIVAQLCEERFATAVCCLVDAESRNVEISLAGHPGPLVYRSQTKQIEQPISDCLPLGLEPSTEYQTFFLDLEPDDAVLLFTDGIVETFSANDEQYDDERLRERFLEYADLEVEEIQERIMRDVKLFRGDSEILDDMTLLALKPSKTYYWRI